MQTSHTEPATGESTNTPATLWKHGAGVGAVVGSAIGSAITVGIAASQPPPADLSGYLIPVAAVSAAALFASICGAAVGCAVVVPKEDAHH